MNFFSILFSICTGTERFAELSKLPLYRSLLHLLLMATLLASLITGLRIPTVRKIMTQVGTTLNAEFGSIRVTSQGFVPARRPEQRRRIELLPGTVLEYFPDTNFFDKDLNSENYGNGVVWTPGIAVFWLKTGNGFMLFPLNYAPVAFKGDIGKINIMPVTPAGIVSFVKDFHHPAGPFMYPGFRELADTMQWTSLGVSYFLELLLIFGGGLMFTTLFTGFFAIGGGAAMLGLRYKNMWSIGLYAGFPGMLVAAVVSGFELPYFDFSTIYLFGMLGYFFVIIGRLQRQRIADAAKTGRDSHE